MRAPRTSVPAWARVALPLVLGLVALGLWHAAAEIDAVAASPYPVGRTPRFHPLIAFGPGALPGLGDGPPLEVAFRSGETVTDALSALDFTAAERQQVLAELARFANLRRIQTTDRYALYRGRDGRPARFELWLAGRGRAAVHRLPDGWRGGFRPSERRVEVRSLAGKLAGSLEASIRAAGGEATLAYAMADVLQWDLDFNRDLRAGDRFAVLYEAVYLDDAYHDLGRILALSYDNAGHLHEAYRPAAADKDAYYDGAGRPLQRMFLRSPLRFTRVTSGFSHRRFHPVLKSFRPHYGIDYGAPIGTPVRATATGVVLAAGWDGGGGKVVKVRHSNGYLTAYLHLSRFADGVRSGARVRQGDLIGYVGSTGLATGPHLDYRVQHLGRWIDPLSIKSVPAEPIPAADLPAFLAWRDQLRVGLASGSQAKSLAGPRLADRPQPEGAAARR
ncbi:MAG: M23 family metallopeptidase [Thermoanaerobaculia bacterium]